MSNLQYILLILGMTLVTYIPRALPGVLVDKLKYGKKVKKFLQLIPYTAMTSLIFPGVFGVDGGLAIGITGGSVAAILAFFKCPIMVCVLGAIAADLVLLLFI